MHNLVKLVQASGKASWCPPRRSPAASSGHSPRASRKRTPKGAAFVWLVRDGVAQSAIVRERMGYILSKAGGASSERERVTGADGEQISLPRSIFAFAIECERVTDAKASRSPPGRRSEGEVGRRGGSLRRHHPKDIAPLSSRECRFLRQDQRARPVRPVHRGSLRGQRR